MNKKIILSFLIFILISLLMILSGCYALEIEDYSIVAGIGIDYSDQEFEITFEIYEENNGQTTNLSSTTKSSKGNTISESFNKISSFMNKKPYLNHASVIIINEDLAKNKFNETINYLLHDVRIRSACYFIISKNQTSKEIFEKSRELKKVIAFDIYKHFDIKEGLIQKWSKTKFNEVINEKINENGTIILPTITYKNECDINGAYLIKSDNEQIMVNDYEVFAFQIFNNQITEGLFNVRNMESYYIKKITNKLKYKNDKILLKVNLKILSYEQISIENKEQYTDLLTKELIYYIEEVYYKYVLMDFDPFRIYNLLHNYYPNVYNDNKNNYYSFLKSKDLNVDINIDLLSLGLSEERI